MHINFLSVNDKLRDVALTLSVAPEQTGSVEDVATCLAEAKELSLWRPVLLMAEQQAVGFAMYGLWEEEGIEGRLWLDRFFIDQHAQGRGLAKAILPKLISHLQHEYQRQTIYLSVYADNVPAIHLYQTLGFVFNGELDLNGERVMVLTERSPINGLKQKAALLI